MQGNYYWIPQAVRISVSKKSKGKCHYCGKVATRADIDARGVLAFFDENDRRYHIDHVKPIADGGTHDEGNLVLACAPCNLSKRKKVALNDPEIQSIMRKINRQASAKRDRSGFTK